MTSPSHTYKISVLVFIRRTDGDLLLIERKRPPNRGQWSPIGGKLEMALGESPHECAVRETREETGLDLAIDDLHLFSMIAEKAYEGGSHWLMFLFDCRKSLTEVPPDIDEGPFAFHPRHRVDQLPLPETDRLALWPVYDRFRNGFVALRADCTPGRPLEVHVDETIGLSQPPDFQAFR
jgi:8-oxo-dGTP diphosphatase